MPSSFLLPTNLAGPYRVKPDQLAQLVSAGLPLVQLAGANDLSALFADLRQQLAFPETFGANFDALYDCLCDRDVTPHSTLVLVFENLSKLDEDDTDTLIAVLQAVSDEWREQNRTFWALFAQAKIDLDPLPSF